MTKYGIVFPGQGSQYPGMGQDLYQRDPRVRELFATAGDVFGWDMASLCFQGPQEALDLTVNTQTCRSHGGYAAWQVFSERVATPPTVMAGHSLGEYAALFAAGAVDLRHVLCSRPCKGKIPPGGGSRGRRGDGSHPEPSERKGGGPVPADQRQRAYRRPLD